MYILVIIHRLTWTSFILLLFCRIGKYVVRGTFHSPSLNSFSRYTFTKNNSFKHSDIRQPSTITILTSDKISHPRTYRQMLTATQDDDELALKYLQRIGFASEDISSLVDSSYQPSSEGLQRLLTAHLLHVPFENMDQHTHPAGVESDIGDTDTLQIKRKKNLPSLDVKRSLNKIINKRRGGFCYEVNLSFCWLLRKLGFKARLLVADVSCKQNIPAHVVILVDELNYDKCNDGGFDKQIPILVDVGFGCPGVCDVILPLKYDEICSDFHGDLFRFDKKQSEFPLHKERFDTVLYRTRIDTQCEEPMYRFHSKDDLDYYAPEFQNGLEYVLTTSPTFNEKRLCVISTEKGHITLGSNYVKFVEQWEVVHEETFSSEKDWRYALLKYFGVKLVIEDE